MTDERRHTLERKFLRFDELLDAKISPKSARANSTEVVDGDPNLLSNINEKAEDAIGYDGGDWATSITAEAIFKKQVAEKWL